jgi:threonine/homoserine/homoserine lactone efflux protein
MIAPHLFTLFVLATTGLMLIPGPNVALITANSVAHGTRFGLLTVFGTSAAMVLQLAATAIGMTTLLGELGRGFEVLRWLGVIYLLWLGLTHWFAPPDNLAEVRPQPRSASRIFLRGFLVSLTNPKTLIFYSAFFPQFVTHGPSASAQVLELSLTFLAIAVTVDSLWSALAGHLRGFLLSRGHLRNRLSGGLLLGAGLGLALARRK